MVAGVIREHGQRPDIPTSVRFGIAPHVGEVSAIGRDGEWNFGYTGGFQQLLLAACAVGVLTIERVRIAAGPVIEDDRFSIGPPDGPTAVKRAKGEAGLGVAGKIDYPDIADAVVFEVKGQLAGVGGKDGPVVIGVFGQHRFTLLAGWVVPEELRASAGRAVLVEKLTTR